MNFIELTRSWMGQRSNKPQTGPVWVNVDHIVIVVPDQTINGARLSLADGSTMTVTESVTAIMTRLGMAAAAR